MNISKIAGNGLIGKLLRVPLYFIPSTLTMPVLQGGLKGKKWIVGSGNHGCWLGSYEYEKQKLFTYKIKKGSVIYDIGAHAGFYTLLASELTGKKGKVVSFEPLPTNIKYLKEHLRLNGSKNVTVIEAAVTEKSGTGLFKETSGNYLGYLSREGSFNVKTVCLDELVTKGKIPPPDYMKIDVEGEELRVLLGAKQVIKYYKPFIFLSTHGEITNRKCCEFLKSLAYDFQTISNDVNESMFYIKK